MSYITLIGVDFGLKNIGLAVGQTLTGTASPLNPTSFSDPFNWQDFDKVIQDWNPDKIIMGWPLTEDGEQQPITKQVESFAKQLSERYNIEVLFMDERYSSLQAQAEFANARSLGLAKRKDAKKMDSFAASNILKRWLDLNS